MEPYTIFPNAAVSGRGIISRQFTAQGIDTFLDACRFVQALPYGYNSNRDDRLILFKERMGSCTTKHAVIAELAAETGLSIHKTIGIYAMTEAIVSGTGKICRSHSLPYIPMVHCFLDFQGRRVDLTQGNHNGKNSPIDTFLFTEKVTPNISAKDEYRLYRRVLQDRLLQRKELRDIPVKRILTARQEGIELLKAKVAGDGV